MLVLCTLESRSEEQTDTQQAKDLKMEFICNMPFVHCVHKLYACSHVSLVNYKQFDLIPAVNYLLSLDVEEKTGITGTCKI